MKNPNTGPRFPNQVPTVLLTLLCNAVNTGMMNETTARTAFGYGLLPLLLTRVLPTSMRTLSSLSRLCRPCCCHYLCFALTASNSSNAALLLVLLRLIHDQHDYYRNCCHYYCANLCLSLLLHLEGSGITKQEISYTDDYHTS